MAFQHITPPETGEKITVNADQSLNVPDKPIIPYIEAVSYTHLRAHETS